jgi:hypothetical protein
MPNRQTGRLLQGMRLAAYGAAYFFAAGAFMSYWPVWLRDRGVTDTEIGTLFMSRQIITVIATLSVGLDRPSPRRHRAASSWRWGSAPS